MVSGAVLERRVCPVLLCRDLACWGALEAVVEKARGNGSPPELFILLEESEINASFPAPQLSSSSLEVRSCVVNQELVTLLHTCP